MNGIGAARGVRPTAVRSCAITTTPAPAMRLCRLMQVPTVFVMTHDSIGLGEDGPTAQAGRTLLAISRATPNTYVFGPAVRFPKTASVGIALSSKENTVPAVL